MSGDHAGREAGDGCAGVGAAVARDDGVAGAGEGRGCDCAVGFGGAHYEGGGALRHGWVGEDAGGGEREEGKAAGAEHGALHIEEGFRRVGGCGCWIVEVDWRRRKVLTRTDEQWMVE